MKSQSSYAPPEYIPLGMSDSESAIVLRNEEPPKQQNSVDEPVQWSSGICACCDDMQSCTLLSAL
ncbi:PLAC8 family protein [Prunus dulcis]|uniref:PLAC8 family protein n=1 Tax=Prunus dulcis TaxID=3755 RepID=A0A5H2XH21_PRUDU|nr:PLAC8 family protein [Prunus dulcis]